MDLTSSFENISSMGASNVAESTEPGKPLIKMDEVMNTTQAHIITFGLNTIFNVNRGFIPEIQGVSAMANAFDISKIGGIIDTNKSMPSLFTSKKSGAQKGGR